MADAVAAGHQVQLAGPDDRVRAHAVAVLDRAGEQPAHGLQPGVRMRRHVHAVRDLVRPVVVGEAPRADQRPGALRQRPVHGHGPRPPNGTSRAPSTSTAGVDPPDAQVNSTGLVSTLLTSAS